MNVSEPCVGEGACQGEAHVCAKETCTLTCVGSGACKGMTYTCAAGSKCAVVCNHTNTYARVNYANYALEML